MRTWIIERIAALRPMLLTAVGICLLLYCIALLRVKKISLRGDSDWIATLFVGMSGRSLLHTAFALVKFAVYTALLLMRTEMTAGLWVFLGTLVLLTLVMHIDLNMLLNELAGGALQGAGLFVCTYLVEYLRIIRQSPWIRAVYWMVAAVLIASSLLILVRELTVISSERTRLDETGESDEAE